MTKATQSKLNNIPVELKEIPQWVVWKAVPREDGSISKVPYNSNGQYPRSYNDTITFNEAIQSYENGNCDGIGFALKNSGYICLDFDGDNISDIPRSLISLQEYTYAEYSPSGNGIHVWFKAEYPDKSHNGGKINRYTKAEQYKTEWFFNDGYVTFTGDTLNDMPISSEQIIINQLYDATEGTGAKESNKNEPNATIEGKPTTDKEDNAIMNKMFNSKNGKAIKKLFDGDISKYENDHSKADLALCNHLAYWTNGNPEQMDKIFRMSKLYRPEKWDKASRGQTHGYWEIQKSLSKFKPYEKFQLNVKNNGNKQEVIPKPFVVDNGTLLLSVIKKVEGMEVETFKPVSRKVPYLTKEFHNLERPQVLYEFQWNERNNLVTEIIPASTIAIRKELLELSGKGFSVNDNNVKDLITYFDRYLAYNDIEKHYAVERLGSIKNKFIHPVLTKDIEIIAIDEGERQTLEAFEVKGTSESWKNEVFERIKDQPKAAFITLASFASVIIKDLRIDPFIVDLSGTTSQGKTTTLRVATSVWGNDQLMNEWNATKVAIERKAAYLNSFPLLLDDTRKADERVIQDIIYQFSGGRSKGRGSLKGSQREYTWQNILLSTGETSINEYAANAGGAAARVIPIVDEPLRRDHQNVMMLHDGIDNNHGAIGIDFLKAWQETKKKYIPEFTKFRQHYINKAKGNEVLSRLANYYAAIHFTGSILKKELNLDVQLDDLDLLFDEMMIENKSIDKPMQFLEEILTDLDSKRESIFQHGIPKEIKAVYRQKQLYLMPSYVNEFLGIEAKQTRNEWLKRDISIPAIRNDRKVDTHLISHKREKFRAIPINNKIIEELGFDFQQRDMNFSDEIE